MARTAARPNLRKARADGTPFAPETGALMVAIGGAGWKLAPSLVAYVNEADKAFPGRDHASDGSIGDQAHASRESDHNPRGGWVHAVDLDEDLAPGLDLKAFAERLRRARDPRIAYVIYEGRAFYSWARNGRAAWVWQPYRGPNAHLHHLHLSILRTAAARNDKRPWGFTDDEEFEMDEKRFQQLVRGVLNEGTGKGQRTWAGTVKAILASVQGHTNRLKAIEKRLAAIEAKQK